MEKLNLDPKGKYLVQDEAYIGQPLADRIYISTPTQAAKKGMRPFDPVKQQVISDLKEVPANTEPIELNGTTYYVNPKLHEVLMDMATYIERIESENRALQDQLVPTDEISSSTEEAKTTPTSESANVTTAPAEEAPANDQNDAPKAKPEKKKAPKRGKK